MRQSEFQEGMEIPESVPRNNKYNLHKMNVGQHFYCENYAPEDIQRLRMAICNYARRNNKKFITRKLEDDQGDKFLVWRTE